MAALRGTDNRSVRERAAHPRHAVGRVLRSGFHPTVSFRRAGSTRRGIKIQTDYGDTRAERGREGKPIEMTAFRFWTARRATKSALGFAPSLSLPRMRPASLRFSVMRSLSSPTTGEHIHNRLLRPLLKSQKAFVLSRNTAKVRASPADMGGLGR